MADQHFPYDIFLSHNQAQKDWTRTLARRLRDDGFKVWFDEWELPKGLAGVGLNCWSKAWSRAVRPP
jgi:hypothetical protein